MTDIGTHRRAKKGKPNKIEWLKLNGNVQAVGCIRKIPFFFFFTCLQNPDVYRWNFFRWAFNPDFEAYFFLHHLHWYGVEPAE